MENIEIAINATCDKCGISSDENMREVLLAMSDEVSEEKILSLIAEIQKYTDKRVSQALTTSQENRKNTIEELRIKSDFSLGVFKTLAEGRGTAAVDKLIEDTVKTTEEVFARINE